MDVSPQSFSFSVRHLVSHSSKMFARSDSMSSLMKLLFTSPDTRSSGRSTPYRYRHTCVHVDFVFLSLSTPHAHAPLTQYSHMIRNLNSPFSCSTMLISIFSIVPYT